MAPATGHLRWSGIFQMGRKRSDVSDMIETSWVEVKQIEKKDIT
jgi:hypothetical protein